MIHSWSCVCVSTVRQFEAIFNLKNQRTCMREAALLDYYVSGFWWAKEANFSSTQLSFTMAVLQMMLDNMRGKYGKWNRLTQRQLGGEVMQADLAQSDRTQRPCTTTGTFRDVVVTTNLTSFSTCEGYKHCSGLCNGNSHTRGHL